MSGPEVRTLAFSPEARDGLRRELAAGPGDVLGWAERPALFERVAAIGIAREVGTANDELARFLFDADRGEPAPVDSLRGEIVEWRGNVGVRVVSSAVTRLEIRARWLGELAHPEFGVAPDGSRHALYFFPKLIARIAALQGVELALVKPWAMNSVFGGFDPAKDYYETNFWELENNDALRFAELVAGGRLALLGTHDLIAHAAGVRAERWPSLRAQADRVARAIRAYFSGVARPSIAALILPYTVGVVLDDLAQPPSYGSESHARMLDALLAELARNAVPANLPTLLTRFPKTFEAVIHGARDATLTRERAAALVAAMIAEIRAAAIGPISA